MRGEMIKVSPANEGAAAGVRGRVVDIIIGVGQWTIIWLYIYIYTRSVVQHSVAFNVGTRRSKASATFSPRRTTRTVYKLSRRSEFMYLAFPFSPYTHIICTIYIYIYTYIEPIYSSGIYNIHLYIYIAVHCADRTPTTYIYFESEHDRPAK